MAACIAVVTSCISCFYYLRFIKVLYFEMKSPWICYPQMDRLTAFCVSVSLFALLFIFVYPTPFYLFAQKLALSLDGINGYGF